MTDNLREFNLAVERFAQQDVPEAVQAVTQKVAMQALRGVVLKTPVDTGRARGNWQTTLNTPTTTAVEITDKTGAKAISDGAVVIGQVQPFGSIWLSNNLPYILRLEGGHSKQAPAGMVALTVAEIESQFRVED